MKSVKSPLLIFYRFVILRYGFLVLFLFALHQGRPMGGGSTSSGLVAERECAKGNECFQGSVDAVALDMTMKEAGDFRLRQSFV